MMHDVRKPSIILSESLYDKAPADDLNEDNEINDFDVKVDEENKSMLIVSCYDSGESTVQNFNLETYEAEEVVKLRHKHNNICLKSIFSDSNTVYTLGFDFKVI